MIWRLPTVFVDGGAIRPMIAKDLNADYLDDM